MKRITYYFILSFIGLSLLSSCDDELLEGEFFSTPDGSDPEEFCENATLAIIIAQEALFNAAPGQEQESCDALIGTLNSFIDFCGEEAVLFQLLLDDLGDDCNIEGNTGGDDDVGSIVGQTYLLTAFEVETPVDLDGDGMASTNIIIETDCYMNETLFIDTETELTATSTSFADIFVTIDGDTVTQMVECVMEEEITNSTYSIEGNIITIDGIEGVVTSTQIVFTVPDGFFAEVISDDGMGSVEVLENITFVYTLQ